MYCLYLYYWREDKKVRGDTSEMILKHQSVWVGGLVYVFDWQLSSQGSLTTHKEIQCKQTCAGSCSLRAIHRRRFFLMFPESYKGRTSHIFHTYTNSRSYFSLWQSGRSINRQVNVLFDGPGASARTCSVLLASAATFHWKPTAPIQDGTMSPFSSLLIFAIVYLVLHDLRSIFSSRLPVVRNYIFWHICSLKMRLCSIK